jgi:hypothetical protein
MVGGVSSSFGGSTGVSEGVKTGSCAIKVVSVDTGAVVGSA